MLHQSFRLLVFLTVFLAVCHAKTVADSDERFPFLADIRTFQNDHLCSGFIVTNRWIVTVAHTLVGRFPASLWVFVGSQESSTNVFSVLIAPHPRFSAVPDYPMFFNDVALIRSSLTIFFSDNVQPISLAFQDTVGDLEATTVGWRASGVQETFTSQTWTNFWCMLLLPPDLPLPGSSFCSRQPENAERMSVEPGDVLVVDGFAAGLGSWQILVLNPYPGFPDVYTRLTMFRVWILSVIS
ncbi:trypsin-like [Phlebotomus argentipes]|uniref:trypsin-like n=1 Tax=Phlebotomus argentipes TaxID=94469 RepID=UPI002892F22A|nr:trypsin-like [Phlebotomus argentipes]